MSTKYTLLPVGGQYPWIQTKDENGKRWIRLALPPGCITEWHLHFPDAVVEWNDIAGKAFMQEVLNREKQ